MNEPTTIVLADDHSLFREGILLVLKKEKSIVIAGEAENGEALLQLIDEVNPDVVITDIDMPLKNGIAVTRILKQQRPQTGVLALTMFDEEHLLVDMMDAGANGYLLKSSKKEELLLAIQSAKEGGTYFCEQTSTQLSKMIASTKVGRKKELVSFSETEQRVMKLLCEQLATKEIAERTKLTISTVEKTRTRIIEKTGSSNIIGVVIYAIRHGYYTV